MFRWGQFNENNYGEVQEYLQNLIKKKEALIAFSNHFIGAYELNGVEKLLGNPQSVLDQINSFENLPESVNRIKEHLESYLNKEDTSSE